MNVVSAMKKFGKSLRVIRKAKNITIDQAAGNTVTTAFLSKVERGKSDISFSKLIEILDRMNVDIDEFILEINNFEKHPQNMFLSDLSNAVNMNSITVIQDLERKENIQYQKSKNFRYQHNIYLCHLYSSQIRHEDFKISDWEPIKNYLMKVDDWSYYEFLLYANAIPFLPTEIIEILSKTAYEKGMRYISLTDNKNGLTETLLNTIETLISRKDIDSVIPYFQVCESLIKSPDLMFERTRLMFLRGALDYLKGEKKGIAKMNAAINALDVTGYRGSMLGSFEQFRNNILKSHI